MRSMPAFIEKSAAVTGANIRVGMVRASSARVYGYLDELRH